MTDRVLVVGGGLSGLVVAYRLATAARAPQVVLAERRPRVGGQIHTFCADDPGGLVVELGAEGFVARSTNLPPLCRDLGIEDQIIGQTTTATYALEEGELRLLADGEAAKILGFQVPKKELGRGIRSLAGGMGQLTDALREALGEKVHLGAPVEALSATDDGLTATLAAQARTFDAAVLTLPTPGAIPLVAPFLADGGDALAAGRRLSNVSVTLLYPRAAVHHPLEASGFILPAAARGQGFRACSFASHKFQRGLDPAWITLRAFFRPGDDELDRDPDTWSTLAHEHIARPLGITESPTRAWVSTWPRALPVYDDAYRTAVADAEAQLMPRVCFAGSHYHGAGIDAAVASAEAAASAILARRASG